MFLSAIVQDELVRASRKARENEAGLARKLGLLKREQSREAVSPSANRKLVLGRSGSLNPAI